MGARPREVDTSFNTGIGITDESAKREGKEGDASEKCEQVDNRAQREHITLEHPSSSEEEVEEEETEEVEDPRSHGCLRGCARTRPCSVCLYLFLGIVLLSSFVSVLVVGFLVAAPYQKASRFVAARCAPHQVIIDRYERKCSCGKSCSSKYPCLRIQVTYVGADGGIVESLMAEDESALHRQVGVLSLVWGNRNFLTGELQRRCKLTSIEISF